MTSTWLFETLSSLDLPEEVAGFCMGRGIPEARLSDIGVKLWDSRLVPRDCPDSSFEHGRRGQHWDRRIVIPLWGPQQQLLGVETRTWGVGVKKQLCQYLLPEASWNPVFVGLTEGVVRSIWGGSDVWITEGFFDMGAVEHIVERGVVLATLRARLSPKHVQFLQRTCTGTVHMAYDNDETGRKQTVGYVEAATGKRRWGALDALRAAGLHAVDEPYRGGKDPGEIWEREGTEGLRRAFRIRM